MAVKIFNTKSFLKYLLLVVALIFILWQCEEFFRRKIGGFAGSYPFVETWVIDADENTVRNVIEELGESDKHFQPPEGCSLIRERDTTSTYSYWLHLAFYYPESDEVVNAWIRPCADDSKTTLAFVSIAKANQLSNRKLINRDFNYFSNRKQIRKFESTFVDKIKKWLSEN